MAGTPAPPIPDCRALAPVGERLASTLYAAHNDRLGRQVTVTVYPALADEATRQRFDAAAATAQRLAAHPNVLAVHDWGHSADGRPWVVTDPQPAETVDTVLKSGGPLPAERALQIGVLVAGAIETAHRAGIVHGDLSPARLVSGPQGEPLVADIGLAEFSSFPGFGALHNPIRYFAPPEVLERTGVTPASDVYSLATTVYALLAGRAPHEKPPDITDSNASLLLRILQIEAPPIVGPDVPAGLEAALHAALAQAPEKRPLRALDLAWSLQDVQRNAGLSVTEPIVLDLAPPAAAPEPAPEAEPPETEPPELPEPRWTAPAAPTAPAPPQLGTLPTWYTDPLPNTSSTREDGLVYLFSDTPPDPTGRPLGAAPGHWATGLDHFPGGPSTPGNGHPPNGNQPPPRPVGLNGTARNGQRRAAPTPPADRRTLRGQGPVAPPTRPPRRHDIERATRGHGSPPVPMERRPLTASRSGGPDAFGTVSTRPGSALDRARRARGLGRSSLAARSPEVGSDVRPLASTQATPRAAAPTWAPAPAAAGPPALPVLVLIVVVILLTLGVAYMVITGDGGTDPGPQQPGAEGTVDASLHQA